MKMKQESDQKTKQQEIDIAWQSHNGDRESIIRVRRHWLLFYCQLQDYKCAYCNVQIVIGKLKGIEDCQATIDHILPKSLGGKDEPNNTLAACAFCNTLKGSSTLRDFLTSPDLIARMIRTSACPNRISMDVKSPHYKPECISRGVSVSVDQQEFRNVYEYCISEGWVRLTVGRTRDRHGQPMTALKKGNVSAIYSDTKKRILAMENQSKFFDYFIKCLSDRPNPSQ